jgi:hypothetical protein
MKMAYDYGFLLIVEFDEHFGNRVLLTGQCSVCKRKWATMTIDKEHAIDYIKRLYRKHKDLKGVPCPAGAKTLAADYERYKLKIKTKANAPLHYNKRDT